MDSQAFLLIAANLILILHFIYVMTVVLGQLVIVVGGILRWAFVKKIVPRVIHLCMILFVAFLDIINRPCPLTTWENQLRNKAGQIADWELTFVERLLRSVVFMQLPEAFFDYIYIGFALLVIATFIIIPPRIPKKRKH